MKLPLKLGLLVLVFGAIAGAMLYGNLQRRAHGDAGFDVAMTPMGGECTDIHLPAAELPFVLDLDPSMDTAIRDEIVSVVDELNHDFGRTVFTTALAPFNYEVRPRHVFVETMNDDKHGHTAMQVWPVSCTFERGLIQLPGLQRDPEKRRAAFKHELGHAMGLAHDAIDESFMWPVIAQWSRSSTVTAADRARVIRRWEIDLGR